MGGDGAMEASSAADELTHRVQKAVADKFVEVLASSSEPLGLLIEAQHTKQRQAYADAHLALLLVDYWKLLHPSDEDESRFDVQLDEIRAMATSRRLPELYGEQEFERVFRLL